MEGSRKKRRRNTRWTDAIKKATAFSAQDLSRASNDEIFYRALVHKVVISWK